MKRLLTLLLLINLTACAGALSWYADAIDKSDPCQYKGKSAGYQLPSFCGAASGHTVQVSRGAYNGTYLINTK